jgi:hypothetical protein
MDMSRFDYQDPSTDPDYCDTHSEPPMFECVYCNRLADDGLFWPYCSAECAALAEVESEEDR